VNQRAAIKLAAGLAGLAACAAALFAASWWISTMKLIPSPPAAPVWEAVAFRDLPGWEDDTLINFRRACVQNREDWCHVRDLRRYIERNFTPYRLTTRDTGVFTGYYTSLVRGSLIRTDEYKYPILKVPGDLLTVDVGQFLPDCKECQGLRITGQKVGTRLVRYPTRQQIQAANVRDSDVLVWLADPVDAFIMHIQGSGLVVLPDGKYLPIGFAASNGLQFSGIGRALQRQEGLRDLSMPSVRRWLRENPDKAFQYMHMNDRYIFFGQTREDRFPQGAMGVSLTPMRSVAIDPRIVPFGSLLWINSDRPHLARLVFAQDTGAAIVGEQRLDFYWGLGEEAFLKAGVMKASGTYYLLRRKQRRNLDRAVEQ